MVATGRVRVRDGPLHQLPRPEAMRRACARIRRAELTNHPNPDFRIAVVDDPAAFYRAFADDLVDRISARARRGPDVRRDPAGRARCRSTSSRPARSTRSGISLAPRPHVQHGRVRERGRRHRARSRGRARSSARCASASSRSSTRSCGRRTSRSTSRRPKRSATTATRIEDARRRRRLLRRHRLVRAHRLLGVAPRAGVRRRPRRVQAGRRAARRAAPDDDHAERAPLVRRRLVVGAAEGEHDRPARDPRRAAPQLLARRRPRRRRLVAALHRAPRRPRPGLRVRPRLDPADSARPTTRSSAASPTTSRSTWLDTTGIRPAKAPSHPQLQARRCVGGS